MRGVVVQQEVQARVIRYGGVDELQEFLVLVAAVAASLLSTRTWMWSLGRPYTRT
jgi:hypothetical protein